MPIDSDSGMGRLHTFVVIMVMIGLVLAVGVLVMSQLGENTPLTLTASNDSWTVPATNFTNASLTDGNITRMIWIRNSSAADFVNYTTLRLSEGFIEVGNATDTCKNGDECFASYEYQEYDTTYRTNLRNSITAVGAIPSTWTPLLVTVVVLGLIMTIVIVAFSRFGNR